MNSQKDSKSKRKQKSAANSDNVFKKLREAANLTQNQLAGIFNVGQQTISNYEKGMTPSVPMLIKYADYFNTTTDYLLGRTDNPAALNTLHENELAENEAKFIQNIRLYDEEGKDFVNTIIEKYNAVLKSAAKSNNNK